MRERERQKRASFGSHEHEQRMGCHGMACAGAGKAHDTAIYRGNWWQRRREKVFLCFFFFGAGEGCGRGFLGVGLGLGNWRIEKGSVA